MNASEVAAILLNENDCEESTNGEICTNSRIYQIVAENLQYSMKTDPFTSADQSQSSDALLPVISNLFPQMPRWKSAGVGYNVMQEWEGYIVSIQKDYFTARITDLTNRAVKEEEADFEINDLTDDDKRRLRAGAIFRWSIGYNISAGGTKQRYSRIVFRNMPAWGEKELKRNAELAADWSRELAEDEYRGA